MDRPLPPTHQLVAADAAKGAAFAVIRPNNATALRLDEMGYTDLGDSLDDMQIRAGRRSFNLPFLYGGETQETSAKYGPVATPHVFVFDQAHDAESWSRSRSTSPTRRPASARSSTSSTRRRRTCCSGRRIPTSS